MNPPVQDNPSDADEPSATPVDEQPAGSPSAESTSDSSNGPKPLGLWRGALVTVLALVMGGVAYSAIMKLKAKPKRHEVTAIAPPVRVLPLAPVSETMTLNGYGTVRSVDQVSVRPQVGGRIVAVHDQLDRGNVIAKGDVLFKIDAKDYELALDLHKAERKRLEEELLRLNELKGATEDILALREHSAQLAEAEYDRQYKLFKQDKIGTATQVDAAQRTAIQAKELIAVQRQTLRLLPHQVGAVKAQIASLDTQMEVDQLQIDRCTLRTPFRARIHSLRADLDDVVSVGMDTMTLVNDELREISVLLDGAEVSRWLRFSKAPSESGWFGTPEMVDVQIKWVENDNEGSWPGRLARIESYDPETRQVTLVVRIGTADSADEAPLVAGMFCQVSIPGRVLEGAYRIPRSALREDGVVHVAAADGKLRQRLITIARDIGPDVFVRGKFETGDQLITNRLAAAVDGMDVTVVKDEK
jgi:hypothetical protein